MVVVGNKLDRADKHRELSADIGREYATSVGAAFAEVSAKTNEGKTICHHYNQTPAAPPIHRHCKQPCRQNTC